ncbi:hypothetical protein LDENG_00133230, partial [Lucifuga dentata]
MARDSAWRDGDTAGCGDWHNGGRLPLRVRGGMWDTASRYTSRSCCFRCRTPSRPTPWSPAAGQHRWGSGSLGCVGTRGSGLSTPLTQSSSSGPGTRSEGTGPGWGLAGAREVWPCQPFGPGGGLGWMEGLPGPGTRLRRRSSCCYTCWSSGCPPPSLWPAASPRRRCRTELGCWGPTV